jgi:PAS domain S-box-containing protein
VTPDDPGRSVFLAICQPALRYGPDGRVLEATGRAEVMAGQPLADRSLAEVAAILRARQLDGTPVAPAELPGARAIDGETVVDLPLTVTASDGRTLRILVSAAPVRDGAGTTGALVIWHEQVSGTRVDRAESEAKYRNLVELSPDAILIHQDGTIVFANRAAAELIGTGSPEDLVGLPILEIVDPAARVTVASNIAMDLKGEDSPFAELDLLCRDGRRVPIQGRGAMVSFRGRPAIQVVLRDVTHRHVMEAALRESEERLRLALKSAEIGIWDRDTVADRVTVSSESFRRYGLEIDTPTGYADWERLIHPDDRGLVEAGRRAAVATGQPIDLEFRVDLPTGEQRWTQFRGRAVTDERGGRSRMIGVLIDVTSRKRAEAALEGVNKILLAALTSETEEALGEVCLEVAQAITQSRYGFIGEVDEDGLHDIAISDPARDSCTITDASGHRPPPGRTFALHGFLGRVLRDGRSLFANDVAGNPDAAGFPPGHPRLTSFLGVPLVRDGLTIGILGVANREGGYSQVEQRLLEAIAPAMVEAFGRKRAEHSLRRYMERLRASNEELQRFAYVASHDLQEPLRSIVSFSQLLERRYRGQLDSDADEFIVFIVDGGTRMQQLIQDLLQVSRIETGAQPPRPTDAEAVVGEVLRSMDAALHEAGVTVEVGQLPKVMADPARFTRSSRTWSPTRSSTADGRRRWISGSPEGPVTAWSSSRSGTTGSGSRPSTSTGSSSSSSGSTPARSTRAPGLDSPS